MPMSANAMLRRRITQYAMLAACFLAAAPAYSQSTTNTAFGANALMLLLTKHLALLAKPLVSRGTLNFSPPDKLAIRTTDPKPEAVVVDGDWVSRTVDGKTRSIQLSAQPEAAGIIEGIRGALSGNRTALDTHYQLSVSGQANQWQMSLVPRDSRVRKLVQRIVMEGKQNLITRITTEMADGDRSVMDVTPKP